MGHSLSKKFTFGSLLMFALPTTIMMVVMSLYTIVDGVFVSRHISTNALSSVNIVYPVVDIVLGINVMLSTGSSAIVAKKMGEGRPDSVRQASTIIILLNIGLGLVTVLFGNLTAVPLSRLLGASGLSLEDCATYLRWQLVFAPALMPQILFRMYSTTEGRPEIGLFPTLLVGASNALLDYLPIASLGLGIIGAAIAAVTGYTIPTVTGLLYFACSRRSLRLVRPHMERGEFKDTCTNGSSEMVTNLSSGIITFLSNPAMMHFAGEDGVMATTIIQYSQFLLSALFMGFSRGVLPAISFNYGSRDHNQLKQAFRTSLIFTAVTSLTILLPARVTGSPVVGIFSRSDTAIYVLARHGFTISASSFLFSGLATFVSALFIALSDKRISVVISSVCTLDLITTSLLVLPFPIGIDGVWLAILTAEFGGVMSNIYYMKKLKGVCCYAQTVQCHPTPIDLIPLLRLSGSDSLDKLSG